MFRRIQQVHFVGVGGIGMSGIAEVLLNMGFRVSGSDLRRSDVTGRLETLGAKIYEGHAAENVNGAHVVVRSTAVREDNPEVLEARRRSIPVIPRAEMLGELMRLKPHTVAVAGSHGKTTTTSMVATVLAHAKLRPSVVVGGVVGAMGSNARLGKSDLTVVEPDESDRSFLMLTPTFAVVTNIDREHMDHYTDMTDVRKCFADFVNKVPFYGAAILCLDDPHVQAVIPEVVRRRITYGLSAQADVAAREVRYDKQFGSVFQVRREGEPVGEVSLQVPGLHNIYNSLAAVAVGLELEVPFDVIAGALSEFAGVNRRFQFKAEAAGVIVVDDYGHHPTEIRATLVAAKLGSRGRRMVVLFQPHRYTRTQDLMEEFARSFSNADVLMVTDIYAASEDPIEGVTAAALVEAVRRFGHKDARHVGTIEEATDALLEEVRPNDMVITLGAGNVYRVGERLPELLKEREQKSEAEVAWRVVGAGSNVLADDREHRYVVVSTREVKGEARFEGERVSVSAGFSLPRLCVEAARQGLSGIEGLGGIPGTVGGALWMNAGAYGHEIGEVVESVRVARGGQVVAVPGGEVKWDYRHTSFKEGELLLGCTLRLRPDGPEKIKARMEEAKQKRFATQPHGARSAGCFFKNPPGSGLSTGKMIDEMGMKGERRGGARV